MASIKSGPASANSSGSSAPRRMSKDLRRNREQRQRIFEAIAKVMAKDGSGAVTMDSIASKMGGSKGTIYYYFKSKGDMLYQMQMYAYDLVQEAVYPILDDRSIPPRQRLERVVYTHMLVACENWRLWRAMWMDMAIPQELARVLSRRRKRYEGKMTELVEQVLAAEGWSCIEPRAVSRVIIGLLDSISRWYRKGGHLSSEEVAALATRCVFDGPFEKGGDPKLSAQR